jgi:hypothetical protein
MTTPNFLNVPTAVLLPDALLVFVALAACD